MKPTSVVLLVVGIAAVGVGGFFVYRKLRPPGMVAGPSGVMMPERIAGKKSAGGWQSKLTGLAGQAAGKAFDAYGGKAMSAIGKKLKLW